MTKEKQKIEKSMIDQFIKDTPSWYKEMILFGNPVKHCSVCGIIPDNMVKLMDEIKVLKSELKQLKEYK